jgi:hypothetical protein
MGFSYKTQAQGFTYTVNDDIQFTYQALITGVLVDEVTGLPLQVNAVITADMLPVKLNVNQSDGALFAVTGYADRVFPNLGGTGYSVMLTITAAGYRTTDVTVTVPAGSSLPFANGAIKLRPVPVRLQGRIVKLSDRSAIAGASVSSGDNTVLFSRSPLYFEHASGVTVNAVTFTAVGAATALKATAMGGTTGLFLNSVAGLAATQILQIGGDQLAEMAVIQSLGPDPAQVNLQSPLNSTFAANDPVQQVNSVGPAATSTLSRSSDAGDGLLVVAPALAATGIQISDGLQTEYHLLNAISDGSGYYHINGLNGVVSLNLKAAAAGFSAASATWFLVYNNPVNVFDFRLKP